MYMKQEIPVWEKLNLSFEEAAAYSGIGINKKLIKRKKFEEYLSSTFEL